MNFSFENTECINAQEVEDSLPFVEKGTEMPLSGQLKLPGDNGDTGHCCAIVVSKDAPSIEAEESKALSGVITVRELLQRPLLFSIPPYQRGYRWTTNNIDALLEDLLEFADSDLPAYCLQPIVLQRCTVPKNGKSEAAYRIVDGQQRLTTLTIILHELKKNITWDMYYETASGYKSNEDDKWLLALLDNPANDKGINGYFRGQAAKAVCTWLTTNATDERKKKILFALGLCPQKEKDVVFLVYDLEREDEEAEDAHDLFNKLNDGKVTLTSAELIKALYQVSTSGLKPEDKLEIGKEWELIEQSLHDERLWRVFFRDNSAPFTRIEELFAAVTDVSKTARDVPQSVFHAVERRVLFVDERRCTKAERRRKLKSLWQEVIELFWWMRSCAADVEIANYLGWISLFRDYQLKSIYDSFLNGRRLSDSEKTDEEADSSNGCRLSLFKQNLMTDIADWIRADFPNTDITKSLSGVKYVKEDRNNAFCLRKLFVLLNILACCKEQEHFRFDLYVQETLDKKKGWDVDHIHLKSDEASILNEDCDVNGIWNLALVSAKTNRSGEFKEDGPKSFRDKRECIRNQMQEGGHFIPLLSQRVYMKFYSRQIQGDDWQYENDGEPYQKEMERYLEWFFKIASGDKTQEGASK